MIRVGGTMMLMLRVRVLGAMRRIRGARRMITVGREGHGRCSGQKANKGDHG